MNIHLSFGFYVSCSTNYGYIEILNKKKINALLKANNPIFFNINDYEKDGIKFIIPFYITNRMDDVYQVKKWHCFCYIFVNKLTKQCVLLYPSVVGIYTRSYSGQNMYMNFIEKLNHKLRTEKYFDNIFHDKFLYTFKLFELNDVGYLQQLFDMNIEPFSSINELIDHKKIDNINNVQEFRDLEQHFFAIYHLEYRAKNSDEKTSLIIELQSKLNKKKEEILILETEREKLYDQVKQNALYIQTEFNEFLLEVKKKLNEVELPVYEKKLVPEYDENCCVICSELLNKRECVFVESCKNNPWEYSNKKDTIVDFIDVSNKFECGHVFHRDCIETWLSTRKPESIFVTEDHQLVHCDDDYTYKTCPLCKGYIIRLIKWKMQT